jgi:hypothetical protein
VSDATTAPGTGRHGPHPEGEAGLGLPRRLARRAVALAVALALGSSAAACGSSALTASSSAAPAAKPGAAPAGAPSATLTMLDGTTTTLSAFRGAPTLVWFIAAGCASCAASIPAVAQHLGAFATARTRILVLGLYGAFGDGAQARSELTQFGQVAAGAALSDPTWTWGLASAALTTAYDPEGVPDDYFLLDATGKTVYHNSVPVSTMGALLAHLSALTGTKLPAPSTTPSSTVPTIP